MFNSKNISLETSLQCFFFDELNGLNSKMSKPLPREIVYYVSRVMDHFAKSSAFFTVNDGKVQEKILGVKLLNAANLNRTEQKKELKDIGDTSLILCGYFAKSLERKIVDPSYYLDLGTTAYSRLNHYIPELYDVPSFYKEMSDCFVPAVHILTIVSEKFLSSDSQDSYLFLNSTKFKAS